MAPNPNHNQLRKRRHPDISGNLRRFVSSILVVTPRVKLYWSFSFNFLFIRPPCCVIWDGTIRKSRRLLGQRKSGNLGVYVVEWDGVWSLRKVSFFDEIIDKFVISNFCICCPSSTYVVLVVIIWYHLDFIVWMYLWNEL